MTRHRLDIAALTEPPVEMPRFRAYLPRLTVRIIIIIVVVIIINYSINLNTG